MLQLCDQQGVLKQVKNRTGVEAYKEVNKKIRSGMRETKEACIQNKCCQLKNSMSDKKMKVAYQILKDIICPKQMNMTCSLLSKDGKCLTDKHLPDGQNTVLSYAAKG